MTALWLALLAAAPDQPVTLLFAGDVTLGAHYEEYVDEQVGRGRPLETMLTWGFDGVREVTSKADLFVVNLECPFTLSEAKLEKNFNFRARPELSAALSAGGVDAVSLANNHLVDFGPAGIADTKAVLEPLGIASFGAGRSLSDARAPAIIAVRSSKSPGTVRVALLGYFFLGARNIEPAAVIATNETPGVAGHFSSVAELRAMLEADVPAAKAKADHVIVFFHWGRELQTTPDWYQVELAHVAIDAGASAVIGSHPHVLQGLERYHGAPIAYSLGNFVFGGNWNPKDKRTALLELTVDRRSVLGVKVVPAFSDAYPERPCQPYLAGPAEAKAILEHLANISKGLPHPLDELPAPHE